METETKLLQLDKTIAAVERLESLDIFQSYRELIDNHRAWLYNEATKTMLMSKLDGMDDMAKLANIQGYYRGAVQTLADLDPKQQLTKLYRKRKALEKQASSPTAEKK